MSALLIRPEDLILIAAQSLQLAEMSHTPNKTTASIYGPTEPKGKSKLYIQSPIPDKLQLMQILAGRLIYASLMFTETLTSCPVEWSVKFQAWGSGIQAHY